MASSSTGKRKKTAAPKHRPRAVDGLTTTYVGRELLPLPTFRSSTLPNDEYTMKFRAYAEKTGWNYLYQPCREIHSNRVREFYQNLVFDGPDPANGEFSMTTTVRGVSMHFTPDDVARALRLPTAPPEGMAVCTFDVAPQTILDPIAHGLGGTGLCHRRVQIPQWMWLADHFMKIYIYPLGQVQERIRRIQQASYAIYMDQWFHVGRELMITMWRVHTMIANKELHWDKRSLPFPNYIEELMRTAAPEVVEGDPDLVVYKEFARKNWMKSLRELLKSRREYEDAHNFVDGRAIPKLNPIPPPTVPPASTSAPPPGAGESSSGPPLQFPSYYQAYHQHQHLAQLMLGLQQQMVLAGNRVQQGLDTFERDQAMAWAREQQYVDPPLVDGPDFHTFQFHGMGPATAYSHYPAPDPTTPYFPQPAAFGDPSVDQDFDEAMAEMRGDGLGGDV